MMDIILATIFIYLAVYLIMESYYGDKFDDNNDDDIYG